MIPSKIKTSRYIVDFTISFEFIPKSHDSPKPRDPNWILPYTRTTQYTKKLFSNIQ